jgi:serine/threonine protein kinase
LTISQETVLDGQGNPCVAIKELKRSEENFEVVAEGEATVLEMMRGLEDQPHLIKAIAYYQKGRNHYFMFPWAEMGDLWEFWGKNTAKTDRDYIIWVFTQLMGLARAIDFLHHKLKKSYETSERSCRHGDLKPRNILCFQTKDGPKDNPRLVITDVGLARVHNEATDARNKTTTMAGTLTHAAPELELNPSAPRSRRFDIWSMGCILLEFVIWLLYGHEKLKEFSENLNGAFYTRKPLEDDPKTKSQRFPNQEKGKACVHPEVEYWISYMLNVDWRCSDGTAIRRLVVFIDTRLLKIELPVGKKSISEQTSASQRLSSVTEEPLFEEPVSAVTTSIPMITETLTGEPVAAPQLPAPGFGKVPITTSPRPRQSTADLPVDIKYRAYAPEMMRELENILALLVSKDIDPIRYSPPPGNTQTPLGPPSRVQFIEQDGHLGVRSTRVR